MKTTNIKCLFGFHEYTIPNKINPDILMCKHCKKFGYRKYTNGPETWYDFDENGNEIHRKYSDGYEKWYADENEIHRKYPGGQEEWLHKGEWVDEKPKDWEYGKEYSSKY